jgi:hypothetical protein
MFHSVADVTLGAIVFGAGVTFQYFINSSNGRSGMPIAVKVLSVAMWALLAYLLWLTIGHVQKASQSITIHAALVLCVGTMAFGCAVGYALSKLGGVLAARRGRRIYQEVMRQKKGGVNNGQQRRWWQ